MNEYDITLKEVLLDSAGLTLRQLTGLDVRSWRDIELPQVNNPRIDLLGETDAGALVHIELQSTNDPAMALRMLNYGLRVYEQHQKLPLQVVLYLGAAPLRMSDRLQLPGLTFEYRLTDIRGFEGRELCDSASIGDNIISILARWPDRQEGIRRVLRRIAEREPAKRAKALAQLMILAGLRKIGTNIEREIRQMPILNEILDHEVLGREYKRGRQDEALRLIRQQAEQLFGPLPAWAETRLAACSSQQLEALAGRILTAASLENLLS